MCALFLRARNTVTLLLTAAPIHSIRSIDVAVDQILDPQSLLG